MIDQKKCRGTGKASGYGCNKLVSVSLYNKPNRVYGLGKSCGCYADWLLNSDAGKNILNASVKKVTAPRRNLEQAFIDKKERASLPTLIKNVVNSFHEYVRARDKGKNCIACGTMWKSDFHASHYYKAELYSTLKFNENNVHGGCVKCNIRKEGNLNQYALNLPHRIGQLAFEELKSLAQNDKKSNHKWDRDKLNELRNYYRNKLKIISK